MQSMVLYFWTSLHTNIPVQRQRKVRHCFAATGSTNLLVEDEPLPIPSFLSTCISWTSYSVPIAYIPYSLSFNEASTPTSHSSFFYESTSFSFTQSLCCLPSLIPSISDMASIRHLLLSSCRTPAMPTSPYLHIIPLESGGLVSVWWHNILYQYLAVGLGGQELSCDL